MLSGRQVGQDVWNDHRYSNDKYSPSLFHMCRDNHMIGWIPVNYRFQVKVLDNILMGWGKFQKGISKRMWSSISPIIQLYCKMFTLTKKNLDWLRLYVLYGCGYTLSPSLVNCRYCKSTDTLWSKKEIFTAKILIFTHCSLSNFIST